MSQVGLSIEQRKTLLQREINKYVSQGYRVLSQTDTTAQLVRPKRFSCLIATLGLLFLVVGLLIYLFIYMASKDSQIYIEVLEDGRIRKR